MSRRHLAPLGAAVGVAVLGALGTLVVAEIEGMGGSEVRHLALLLLPALVATVAATVAADRVLSRTSLRQRFLAVAAVAVLVSLANVIVLGLLMSVSGRDATVVGVLLVYSIGSGVAAALVSARAATTALDRLTLTSQALADGDLDARAGRLGAGPELDLLAATLDQMADRLGRSIARERLAEARRRDLVTAVSHDLRTPLAGLQAMVEAVADGVVDDEDTIRRYAGEMRRAVGSLAQLVDDLFDLVQLDAGAIEAESKRARLADVVQSALAACEAQASDKGLVLEARLDPRGDCMCSPRLVRVLQNLLQNAIRHTPADGTVRMEARRGPDGLEFVVEDTGEGIPEEALQHVFEPFWRGDASRSGNGSGLGLALAKRIVDGLGGHIEVESRPAFGSRFSVVLPDAS